MTNDNINILLARITALEALVFALVNNEKSRDDELKKHFFEARFSLETSVLHKGDSDAQIERIRQALDRLENVFGWKSQ